MFIINETKRYDVSRANFSKSTLTWSGIKELETPITGTVITYRNDGFVMREDEVSAWLRQTYENGILTLTNLPEPEPYEPPEPIEPMPTVEDVLNLLAEYFDVDLESEVTDE